jgi:aspartate kinase
VPGVLNADPKWFDETVKIDQLTYQDAIELAYYGATVIHPKTIKPLQNRNIPLYVRSFLHPQDPGTVIGKFEKAPAHSVVHFQDESDADFAPSERFLVYCGRKSE